MRGMRADHEARFARTYVAVFTSVSLARHRVVSK
jgi:hypothetical protein